MTASSCLGRSAITALPSCRSAGTCTFETEIVSDSAALHGLVAAMVEAGGPALRVMRDPTRGGLAATLNELAQQSGVGFRIEEDAVPVKPEVAAACELLGLDPLYVANEGKLVAVVAPEAADAVLAAMRVSSAWTRCSGHRRRDRRRPSLRADDHIASEAAASSIGCRASNSRGSVEPLCASCCSFTVSTA